MSQLTQVLILLDETLKLNGRAQQFTVSTPLLGSLPELDSLGVANLIGSMEKKFQFRIEDDELDGSVFKNVGSLAKFIEFKTAAVNKAS